MKTIIIIFAIFFSTSSWAIDTKKILITDARIRLLPPSAKVTALYMNIKNENAEAVILEKIKSEKAQMIELHTMEKQGEIMKMKEVPHIEIPANQKVSLAEGGLHVMMMGLSSPLKSDEIVKLQLFFRGNVKIDVEAKVVDLR